MGRRPGAELGADAFHRRRLKIAESYRLRPGIDLAQHTSVLAGQADGETRHLWGFIGHHRQFVIVGPQGEIATARSALDARLKDRRLEEREVASELADSVRFMADLWPVKCDQDGAMFTIKLPKDLEHLGILPKEHQDVIVVASGEIIEVWRPDLWLDHQSKNLGKFPALLDPPRSTAIREFEDAGD